MSNHPWQRPPDSGDDGMYDVKHGAEQGSGYTHMGARDSGPVPRPNRLLRLSLLIAGVLLLVGGLSLLYPDRGQIGDIGLLRAVIILLIFGGAAAYWSRSNILRLVKMAGLWLVIVLGLSLFYLFKSDVQDRFIAALNPSRPVSTDAGIMVLRERDGHFWLRAQVNGEPVRLMVDTGASNVVLSPADARRIGLDVDALNFDRMAETANGKVAFATTKVRTLTLADETLFSVPVTVNQSDMHGSLLGLSVLSQFSSVEFRGDTLILRR